jgi:predicted Zn-dependent peptidase
MQLSYLPSNTVVAVAGNIGHDEVVQSVSGSLGNWENRQHFHKYKSYKLKECMPVKIEKRKIEQAHLCLALPGLSRFHPKRYHLDVLNIILGEGMSSVFLPRFGISWGLRIRLPVMPSTCPIPVL